MKIEITKTPNGTYRIISTNNRIHPVLCLLASQLKHTNKLNGIKIGIFNISSSEFKTYKTVYSYISNKTEKMNKKNYYKWLKGKRQFRAKKEMTQKSLEKAYDTEMAEIAEILQDVHLENV